MRHSHRSAVYASFLAIGASILVQSATAQAEPGILRGPAATPAFAGLPAKNTIYADRLPGDAAGVFTCCLTTQAGPQVQTEVVLGAYDQVKGTFTPTNEAAALNTARWEYALSLEPGQGRYAVLIRGDGAPSEYLFAARAGAGLPFPAPAMISGVPAKTLGISLGHVAGKLKLFYVPDPWKTLVMQDLDISNPVAPKLTGTATVVARPTLASNDIPHAYPITGKDGDVEGLLIIEGSPGSVGLVFQAGLDPNRPGSFVVPSCGANCNVSFPTVAGGRLLFASRVGFGPSAIQDVEVAWLLGDVVAPGGTADITGAVSRAPTASTLVMLSGSVIPKVKLPSPFDVGHLGIEVNLMIVLGFLKHGDASQRGSLSLQVPNDPNLRGFDGGLQGLSLDANNWPLAFTNTAWLSIR